MNLQRHYAMDLYDCCKARLVVNMLCSNRRSQITNKLLHLLLMWGSWLLWLEIKLHGCNKCISKWWFIKRCFIWTTWSVCGANWGQQSLHGLKQAPYVRYPKVNAHFSSHDFTKKLAELTFFVFKEGNEIVLVVLSVNDIRMICNNDN